LSDYEAFVATKRVLAPTTGIETDVELNPLLFGFQADITRWALRRGRAAIWADCGLGKSWMALEWARVVSAFTGLPVLILTPLAVAAQFVREGAKLGIVVRHAREQSDVSPGVNVTNYERLHKFELSKFGGVVADESSILKDYASSTRNAVIEGFSRTPFRLACTATPAPNDHMELGNHAEFLGVMSRVEMLSMFFVHDGGATQDWRLKGHAVKDFWRWVCSWAVAVRSPSDLGYDDDGFRLPDLEINEHVVSVGQEFARNQGSLFAVEARGLSEQREARKTSLADRVALAAGIVNAEPTEPWLVWCDLNDESTALTSAIGDATEIRGSDDPETKEARMGDFTDGRARVLVTKPSIAGWGLNWQHCARVVFVGLSHSFEAWYQAIRRVYRFGQRRRVICHVITSDAEGAVVANLKRKQADADRMVTGMVAEMGEFTSVGAAKRDATEYRPTKAMTIPIWIGQEELA
jgi:helicase-like protein